MQRATETPPLTDLGHAPRPPSSHQRGDSPASSLPPSTRKKHQKRTTTSRALHKIAVQSTATAAAAAYRVESSTNVSSTDDKTPNDNNITGGGLHRLPPVRDTAVKTTGFQRSQTAPNGLRRQQHKQQHQQQKPGNPTDEIASVVVDDREPGALAAPRGTPALGNRTYGEMIDTDDVADLCFRLGMTRKDVWRLRKAFNDEDGDNTNTITRTSFFFIIHEENRALTTSLLRLAKLSSPTQKRITFDEFLRCVVTFASFTEPEVLQFFFQVYCDNTTTATRSRSSTTSAAMVESDLMKLGHDLQVLKSAFAGNIRQATSTNLTAAALLSTTTTSTNWTFADFERFSRQHLIAFYPLFQIQRNVRRAGSGSGLGESYWIQKSREKIQLQQLLLYMRQHHGLLPPLSFTDRVWNSLVSLRRPTAQTRVRELAAKLYTG